jgi:transposase
MYVVTTKRKVKDKTYTNYLIRKSYRENGKVKNKTVSNITALPIDLIDHIRKRLKSGKPLTAQGFSIKRSLPHGHVAAVLQSIERCGLTNVIASKRSQMRDIVVGLIVQRFLKPASKLASYKMLTASVTNSLCHELQLSDIKRDNIYQALDWLFERKSRIENKLAKKHLKDGTVILYDLTSSYYTGKMPNLVRYGYNRDGKKDFPQIVFGLICNAKGCPVGAEVFPGNTADSETMPEQIRKVQKQFGIKRVIWVGDRGMITGKIIDEVLRTEEGADWITALRSSQVKKLVNQEGIQLSIFDKQDLVEIASNDYPGERLMLCRNPLLAEERNRKRKELLASTCRNLDKIVKATVRKHNPLRGIKEIALKVGKVIDKHKMAKHIQLNIQENRFDYEVNKNSISEEETLDGLYVIRTSLKATDYTAEKTVETYKSLSKVEWAFRSLKTAHLEVRPVYHWKDERIEAHIFLCVLAYYVEWHIRQDLAPILYDDDNKQEARAKRSSIVAPAERSEHAKLKANTHKNKEKWMVHSMETALEVLGTICKNEIQVDNSEETFYETTVPTEEQENILKLLKTKL